MKGKIVLVSALLMSFSAFAENTTSQKMNFDICVSGINTAIEEPGSEFSVHVDNKDEKTASFALTDGQKLTVSCLRESGRQVSTIGF